MKSFQFLGSLKTATLSIVDLATLLRIESCVFGSIPIQKVNAQWNPITLAICPMIIKSHGNETFQRKDSKRPC